MITINEAFSILQNTHLPLKEVEVPLFKALNCVLSQTIHAPISLPPFRQSNMDGFALAIHGGLNYRIIGEVKAGDIYDAKLEPGQAVKIFTGAAVPDSAKAVIQIEKVTVTNDELLLEETVKEGRNIRPQGSQIQKDAVALEKGSILNSAAIGFLAGLGFTEVPVFKKPHVGIVITGNELMSPSVPLAAGRVYESNSLMLVAALKNANFENSTVYQVKDDFDHTKAILKKALDENDLVIVSGGISVGDYDFVGRSLESLGCETLFYKVSQKPGMPLYAAKYREKLIFALPGNPAASLTCFYVYVQPTLRKLSGLPENYGPVAQRKLSHDFDVDNSRSQFLKARLNNDEVAILSHQESSMLNSFATANALVFLNEGKYSKHKGDLVAVYLIN